MVFLPSLADSSSGFWVSDSPVWDAASAAAFSAASLHSLSLFRSHFRQFYRTEHHGLIREIHQSAQRMRENNKAVAGSDKAGLLFLTS